MLVLVLVLVLILPQLKHLHSRARIKYTFITKAQIFISFTTTSTINGVTRGKLLCTYRMYSHRIIILILIPMVVLVLMPVVPAILMFEKLHFMSGEDPRCKFIGLLSFYPCPILIQIAIQTHRQRVVVLLLTILLLPKPINVVAQYSRPCGQN